MRWGCFGLVIHTFTIPIGFLLGGLSVDKVFEPLMAAQPANSALVSLFGENKGSGAAMLFFIIGIIGVLVCLIFNYRLQKYKWIKKSQVMERHIKTKSGSGAIWEYAEKLIEDNVRKGNLIDD